jgi:hypothetical protein
MFGFTKKRKPETLAKQFFQIVSDPVASEEFWTSFEARNDDLLRACVSRFCYPLARSRLLQALDVGDERFQFVVRDVDRFHLAFEHLRSGVSQKVG